MPKTSRKYPKKIEIHVSEDMFIKVKRLFAENDMTVSGGTRQIYHMILREEETIKYPRREKK